MAWLKIETHTPDKPEIFDISRQLGISPDEVFGKCFRLWAWFDAHTTNGETNGVGVSDLLVDRICGVKGFAEAMWNVGWLDGDAENYCIKNFERHNGETAKTRALTAKRVSKHANAKLTQAALPREEKIRVSKPPISPKGIDVVFDALWKAYPRKVGKGAAEKAWAKLAIKPSDAVVLAAISAQRRSEQWQKDGGQFIPHPSTWISQRRWEDGTDLTQDDVRPSTDCVFCGATGSKKIGNAWYCFQHDQHSTMEAAYD